MQKGLPISPAHPEEPFVFVSISSGEEDQKQESRAGGCMSLEQNTKGFLPPLLSRHRIRSEDEEKGL